MPAARNRKSKAKRPRIPSEDRTDGPEKRARNGGESPLPTNHSNDEVNRLRDRTRASWLKGKWREKTPKRTLMSLAQAADDLFIGTSKQGALANAALSQIQLDTSILEIASTVHGSSPASPKDVPIPETPVVNIKEQELQEEIDRLRGQLEQKDQIISRHESTIETVQNSVHCPVCLDPLWKPFVVVPCGHMACQGCLISWFTSPPPGAADHPDERPRPKRKTCPHCRGLVISRPVEVYGLGGVVATLHPQPPVPSLSNSDAPADPWGDIFRPPPPRAMRDDEDGVRRCPACFYEIWDGECVGCGLAFSDASGDTAFGSDDGSVSVFDDEPRSIYNGGGSLYGGTLYGDEGSNAGSGLSVYGDEVAPVFDYPPRGRVYESYDEDDDEDDSFIDDSELPRPPPAAYFHHYAGSDSEDEQEDTGYHSARGFRSSPAPAPVHAYSRSRSHSSSDLSDDDEDDEEDDFLPGRGRRGRSAETETLPETAEEADDEDDDEEDEASVNPNVVIDIVSDDEDDDEPPVRVAGRRSAAERWGGWSRDEGEPPRGRSLSRRRVMSPEDGSESEYFSD